jgi:prepilin-type N-terminal cleavage/methylation domain-containing protein
MFGSVNRIQLNRRQRGLDGFTLIELLIVIVVLGILSAIVVFALSAVTGSSAVSACNTDAKTVSGAVSAYDTQVGSYPAQGAAAPDNTLAYQESLLVPTYLKSWPSNANYYSIGLTPDGQAVTVELAAGTPGVTADANTGTTYELFEADAGTTPSGAAYQFTGGSLANLGICAGA